MRVLFLTDNFPPESNAPATRTYEHCVEWVKKGAKVTVVTCNPNYPKGEIFNGYKNKWKQKEMMDGIEVIRVWSYISPNRGLFRRTLDYLSFCITAFLASLTIKTDVIVATSPQLFTALSGYFVSLAKRKPWIMEVRDLWPESIKAVEAMDQGRILKILDRLVIFLYRKADNLVVVTDAFKERVVACGVSAERVHVVKNGVHIYKFKQRPKNQNLLEVLDLENKFIVGYIGTLGMAHKLDFILDCAKKVKEKAIHFLIIGEGAFKMRLVRKMEALQLENVTILDGVPKSEVANYISIIDVALVNLRKKETFKKVIPSKMFENAAMAKPILLGVEGEAKEIIESFGAGLCFEPEHEKDFLHKLEQMYYDKSSYEAFQKAALILAKNFDRKVLALNMFQVLAKLSSTLQWAAYHKEDPLKLVMPTQEGIGTAS